MSELTQGPWSTGLCDCCEDVSNCCLTCCCPCITFGKIAEIVDKGAINGMTSCAICAMIGHLTGHSSLYTCSYRYRLRQEYMLKASPCGDCLVHHFCQTCVLCQEYRELKNHGFDMTMGWQENVNRQNREVVMAPAVQGGMRR